MLLEFAALATGVGHVTNIAKTLLDAHDQAERDALRIELGGAILETQAKMFEVQALYGKQLEVNETLKKQLVIYERWEQKSARYSLQELAPGIVAYTIKPGAAAGEPKHWLCPTCYDERKTSILHPDAEGSDVWECPRGCPHLIVGPR